MRWFIWKVWPQVLKQKLYWVFIVKHMVKVFNPTAKIFDFKARSSFCFKTRKAKVSKSWSCVCYAWLCVPIITWAMLTHSAKVYFLHFITTPDQTSVSHFNHPCLSLISLRKNGSTNQDSQCKSWLKLVILRSEIRERRGCWKLLEATNKKCDTEFWWDFNLLFCSLLQHSSTIIKYKVH